VGGKSQGFGGLLGFVTNVDPAKFQVIFTGGGGFSVSMDPIKFKVKS